ncbi:hypothetical protein SDRG_00364 [Saprolegnia diclina VS20]|uniref:Potassium channel tetramerisation-type BTB domain-containing protein n=1 Tax=Saprolegnia diclina (strain VS20) TaxID=1156394 RepID=T0R6T4_SAPDV|nr:hypothetical protein SDRG_00364 [Saprolegnia diclina VS20]EQC42636.1 hypothetical protein SDRG_00364 [Saprolegnia diclina VS20]|eukprot:XP_008604059.1 hypothetical protein SDRG_00364 [Saprolegnia diclina VS20]
MFIQLNVGGRIFCTSEATLAKVPGSFLEKLLRRAPDVDSAYFLDLDPTYFEPILNHLRCDAPLLASLAPHEIVHISRQLEFLRLPLPVPLSRMWTPTDTNMQLLHTNFCQTVAVTKNTHQRSVLALVPSDRFAVRMDFVLCSISIGLTTQDAFALTAPSDAHAAYICGGYSSFDNINAERLDLERSGSIAVVQYDRDAQKITFDVDGERVDSASIDLVLPPTTELFPFVSFYAMPYSDTDGSAYLGQVTLVPVPSSQPLLAIDPQIRRHDDTSTSLLLLRDLVVWPFQWLTYAALLYSSAYVLLTLVAYLAVVPMLLVAACLVPYTVLRSLTSLLTQRFAPYWYPWSFARRSQCIAVTYDLSRRHHSSCGDQSRFVLRMIDVDSPSALMTTWACLLVVRSVVGVALGVMYIVVIANAMDDSIGVVLAAVKWQWTDLYEL